MRQLAILLACLALAACATAEPQIKTQIVNVPVAVHCKPDIKADPVYPDTAAAIKAAPSIFERVQLLLEGRKERDQRLAELGTAIQGCE